MYLLPNDKVMRKRVEVCDQVPFGPVCLGSGISSGVLFPNATAGINAAIIVRTFVGDVISLDPSTHPRPSVGPISVRSIQN